MSARYDAVIIGSGISSLTSAVLLGMRGLRVCVLEQHTKPGGYLHCFSRFGERFDTGAHYVGAMEPGQPFHALLTYLGIDPTELFSPLDPDGFDVLKFPDFEISLPKGYEETIARLSGAFPSEAPAIRAYFEMIRSTAARFPTYEFNEDFNPMAILSALETPLSSVVERLTSDPLLRSVLYAYCALHGVEAHEVGFGLHAILTDSLIRGPYGLKRGGDALAARFVERVRALGGTVLMKKRVVSIENTGKAASAVVTQDEERFEAEWIISGIHPKPTFELLRDPSPLTPAFRERLAGIAESPGIFGIYATCKADPGMRADRNYYFFRTQDPALMLKSRDPLADVPNAAFISPAARAQGVPFPLNVCAIARPEWFMPWKDTRYGRRPEEYEELKERYASRVLELVDQRWPGLSLSIGKQATSTPLSNLHFNGTPEGSCYGIYHSIANTGARALGPRTHVANLLLTGQNCLFPGLLGASVAVIRTAGHIIGIKPLLGELRRWKEREAGAFPADQQFGL